MFNVSRENNVPPRLSAHPYQRPLQTPLPSSEYCGRTLTQRSDEPGSSSFTQNTSSGAAISLTRNNLALCSYGVQSQAFVQHSASQVQPMHQPVPAFGTQHVTPEICLDMAEFAHNLLPQESELFFKSVVTDLIQDGVMPTESELFFGSVATNLVQAQYEVMPTESELFFETVATNPAHTQYKVMPTALFVFRQQQTASKYLSLSVLVEIRNTVCAIAYNIWGYKQIGIKEFCELNDVRPRSLYKRLTRYGTWSSTDRAKKTLLKLYGDNYGHLMASVLKALENADKNEYISAWKVNVGKLDALLCDECPIGTKSHASTEGPLPSTSGAGPSAQFN